MLISVSKPVFSMVFPMNSWAGFSLRFLMLFSLTFGDDGEIERYNVFNVAMLEVDVVNVGERNDNTKNMSGRTDVNQCI